MIDATDTLLHRAEDPEPVYRHSPTCPMSQREPVDWPPVGTVPPTLDEPDKARTERIAQLATLRELLGHLRNTAQEEWADAVAWGLRALQEGHP